MMRQRSARCVAFCLTAVATYFIVAAAAALVLVQPAAAQKRVALIVGNSAYAHAGPLANPANDAADMAAALKEVGIEVLLGLDLDKRAFDLKVRDFARALADADTGIFFYAGPRPAGGRTQLPGAGRCAAAERARSRLRGGGARFRAQADGAGARNQDQHRVPRRLPRQSAGAQPGPHHGHALGQRRPRAGAGADGRRHLHRLLDAAGQRGARRLGSQLAVHGGAGEGRQGARAQSHRRHDRRAQGGAQRDQRQAGAVGPLGADGRFLFPPGLGAGIAAEDGARDAGRPTAKHCSSGCGRSRRS